MVKANWVLDMQQNTRGFLTGVAMLISLVYMSPGISQPVKIRVTEGTNMAIAVSPDGKTIAMDLQGTIYTLPITGGPAKGLTDGLGDERQPAWSPNGEKIVFHSYRDGTYHIWMINKNGSGLHQVTHGLYDHREPQWSADGTRIIFSSDRSGNYDIWQLNLIDGKYSQLTDNPADDYNPAWSADGASFVYISNRKEAGGLYKRDANRSEQLLVPFNGGIFAAPAFSFDGQSITFNGLYGGKSLLQRVMLNSLAVQTLSDAGEDVFPFRAAWTSANTIMYTSNGLIQKRSIDTKKMDAIPFSVDLVLLHPQYPKKIRDFDFKGSRKMLGILGPVLSPDGKDIAFAAAGNLWLLKSGVKEPVKLTDDAAVDLDPTYSPDGTQLAYVTDRQGGKMALWVRNLHTGSERQLTFIEKDVMYPSWSPDGGQIALLINETANVWGSCTVNVLNVASGEIRQVHGPLFVPGKPSWSADGTKLALSALEQSSARFREGISRILLISLDGRPDQFISPEAGRTLATREKNGPVWSPDGKKMAFIKDGLLWSVDVKPSGEIAGGLKKLTTGLADVPTWSGDSKTILFISTDRLKKVHIQDGSIEDVPMNLSWSMQQPEGIKVIHAGRLFDGRTNGYKTNVDVTLNGNRIVKVEPHRAGSNAIDASDKTMIPGLFEMHTHQYAGLGNVQGRTWLAFGITSVRETGADPYDALERKEAWNSGVRAGPREFFAGYLLDGKRVYYGLSNSIASKNQLQLELQRAIELDYDFIKTYVRFPDYFQKYVAAFAHRNGIPVTSHEIYPATQYGIDAVEHIKATSRRGYSPKQSNLNSSYNDVIQIVSKSGMNITPTISLFGGFYLRSEADPDILNNRQFNALYPKSHITAVSDMVKQRVALLTGIRDTYGETKRVIRRLADAGARITPGTDSPFLPYGLSLHVELQCLVDAGLSPFEALRAATLWSAQAVGVEKDLGTIEVGKLADFVLVDGDPLNNIKDAWNVKTVFKNGIQYDINDLLQTR